MLFQQRKKAGYAGLTRFNLPEELIVYSHSAAERRRPMNDAMHASVNKGIDCLSCSGVCCTFVANSMMTTPLETLDILVYLHQQDRLTEETRSRLTETVRRYRLNHEAPGDGRRRFVRRTYTCPFFNEGPRGCSISRTAKPYGCLGFNPRVPNQTEGGDCAADTALLQAREDIHGTPEARVNLELKTRYQLDWDKLPMPVALLSLWDRLQLAQ